MTTPRRVLVALGALWFAQGLPYGFFTLALPVLLRQQGHDLATVSASSLLALPWGLKWIFGPAVDRYGTRRSWIVPLQVATVVALLVLAPLASRAELWALAWGMLAVSLFASTQDVATDALAVQLLDDADRGFGNGLQVGAYRLGMVVGGSGVPAVFALAGPAAAFVAMAALLALTTVPVVLLVEPPRPPDRRRFDLAAARDTATAWARDGAWLVALVVYKAGDHLASPMARARLVDEGWDLVQLGLLSGIGGSGLAAIGALAGGALAGTLGRRRSLAVFGVVAAAVQAGFVVFDPAVVWLVDHLVGGMATVALFTVMMDRCRRPGLEATDYTLQAAVYALGAGLIAAGAGSLAEAVGYGTHFSICAVATLAATAFTTFVTEDR